MEEESNKAEGFPYLEEFKGWIEDVVGDKELAMKSEDIMDNIFTDICPKVFLEDDDEGLTGQIVAQNIPYFRKYSQGEIFIKNFLRTLACLAKDASDEFVSLIFKYLIFLNSQIIRREVIGVKPLNGLEELKPWDISNLNSQLQFEDEVFTKKDLLEIFRVIFLTQKQQRGDCNHKLSYLELAKVLPNFDDWLKSFLKTNVKFIISERGSSVQLKDINYLTFTSEGEAVVNLNRDKDNYLVFTKRPNKKIITFKDSVINEKVSLTDLSLDYDTPLLKIINNIGDTVPNIDKFNEGEAFDSIGLLNEFKAIHSEVSLTVMNSRDYNIKNC